MRQDWECSACQICRQMEAKVALDIVEKMIEEHGGVQVTLGNVDQFIFPDNSVLIIDEKGNPSFILVKEEPSPVVANEQSTNQVSFFGRIRQHPWLVATAIGGVLLAGGAAIAGAVHHSR